MTGQRVVETTEGIQNTLTVHDYDRMARHHRDKGYTDIKALAKYGLNRSGTGLEIGPGPGYMGLEWLKGTTKTTLVGLEISEEMIKVATRNAAEYGFTDRVTYVHGNAATAFPFADASFDVAFSFSSLHEWDNPKIVLAEMYRVLKPGGRLLVSDLRRDILFVFRFIMRMVVKAPAMQAGLKTSLAASYTVKELESILADTNLRNTRVDKTPFGLCLYAEKPSSDG
ncbi:MAG: class I SAM-dependent methyltransferase [Planctomycetes bacterium]|nr:class I SAM-dependent methyltransferase [Planctomycetota bacterium]